MPVAAMQRMDNLGYMPRAAWCAMICRRLRKLSYTEICLAMLQTNPDEAVFRETIKAMAALYG